MTIIKARKLKIKDKIACVAPASPFDHARFEKGVQLLENMGFVPVFNDDVFEQENYLAGNDRRRLNELNRFIEDDEIKAIMAIRGGFGSMRLFEGLDFAKIAQNPKAWLGFSDISALFSAIYTKSRLVTIHGPQVVSLPEADSKVQGHWLKLMTESDSATDIFPTRAQTLVSGKATGRIFVINLAMLTSLLATPYLPDFTGHILAIEDVGEWPYRLDRMLTQLDLANVFRKISGLVLGHFTFPENAPLNSEEQSLTRVRELAEKYSLPAICGCPFGHIDNNYPVASGIKVELDADKGTLVQLEPALI